MTTVIHCGTLIDGNGGDPMRNATIVIEGESIAGIRTNGDAPRGATVIDATGLTVMPGMIDCHVHLMTSPPKTMEQRLSTPFSLAVAEALTNARTSLEHGFTTLRDAGGTPRGVRTAIEQGLFPGPRLRVAVTALSQTGATAIRPCRAAPCCACRTWRCRTTLWTVRKARARPRARC